MTVIIGVNTYHEDIFFATTTKVATKSIKLTANNEKHTSTTNTFAYLVILEIDYS